MDTQELLKTYFSENKLMQLATIADGQPWMCNVYFVTDENHNIYWTSAKKRRHSQEILNNPIVAATIVHDQDKKQALQVVGKSYEVPLADSERVHKLYGIKFGEKPSRLEEVMANSEEGRAYWILKPESLTFWDEVNFPDTHKQEVIL